MAANYVTNLDINDLCLPQKFDAQKAYRQSKFAVLSGSPEITISFR
jgi:hypothetical protein